MSESNQVDTEELWQELLEAIEGEDFDRVMEMVNEGALMHASQSQLQLGLGWAVVQGGGFDIVAALLQAGANPNAIDEDGDVPMLLACRSIGSPNVLRLLLEAGGDPLCEFEEDEEVVTPLESFAQLWNECDEWGQGSGIMVGCAMMVAATKKRRGKALEILGQVNEDLRIEVEGFLPCIQLKENHV